MGKTVVIHQPDFLSYLGFFHRFLHADLWVILDTAQFVTGTSKSWQNRDLIKTEQGGRWLTVGVKKPRFRTPISEIELADSSWREENLNLIRANYRKSHYFKEIMPFLEELYAFPCTRLVDFNLKSSRMLMQIFDIRIDTVLASSLGPAGKSNQMLVDILEKLGAERSLSGLGARGYFAPEPFERAGIEVVWQEFSHPTYPQQHGDFIPYLSSIDLLFNCGIAGSGHIIRSIG